MVIGGDAPLTIAGVDAIWHVRHAELGDYAPEAWGDALHQLAVEIEPAAVVATGTERGNEVLAHVAAIADEPFAANVVHATPGRTVADPAHALGRQPARGRDAHRDSCRSSSAHCTRSTGDGRAGNAGHRSPSSSPSSRTDAARTRIVDRVQVAEGITLTTAPVVVSGGRGVGSEEGFAAIETLAELLGAAVGCSRVVTNQGWRPHADQVGQTGKRVAPDLYIACGISGAIQHWVGMQAAKHVLAINTDPDAPMVTKADYAVDRRPARDRARDRRRAARAAERGMTATSVDGRTPTISCRGVWKVFGPHPERIVGSADADLPAPSSKRAPVASPRCAT